jgi:transcriptional regulator with PAS, ATPase and Fis domain
VTEFSRRVLESILRRQEHIENMLEEATRNLKEAERLDDIPSPGYSILQHLKDYEADIIKTSLDNHKGNKDATAQALGFSKEELMVRIKVYGLNGKGASEAEDRLKLEEQRLRQERFLNYILCGT